jgi:hypothetical protein
MPPACVWFCLTISDRAIIRQNPLPRTVRPRVSGDLRKASRHNDAARLPARRTFLSPRLNSSARVTPFYNLFYDASHHLFVDAL